MVRISHGSAPFKSHSSPHSPPRYLLPPAAQRSRSLLLPRSAPPMTSPATSYWCYRCSRLVRAVYDHSPGVACPDCDGGFLESVDSPPRRPPSPPPRRHTPMFMLRDDSPLPLPRRARRSPAVDRSPFNPVIVLRGPAETDAAGFELYYDDGAGSGLRPLPASMSDFLMGSGFDRLLDQLAQIEINGVAGRGWDHPPASKASVDSMPIVEIADAHISTDSHCAVCKDAFEIGTSASEMPCKHIYHRDCILPWLALRNSCPVCRHEMPTDVRQGVELDNDEPVVAPTEEEAVGLTIWRLPGGGFAVGRFSGGRRAGERELPVVYTEMDGGFNNGGAPRRISWTSRGSRSREGRGIGRAFRNFFSFFSRRRSSSDSVAAPPQRSRSHSATRRAWLLRTVSGASPAWY